MSLDYWRELEYLEEAHMTKGKMQTKHTQRSGIQCTKPG